MKPGISTVFGCAVLWVCCLMTGCAQSPVTDLVGKSEPQTLALALSGEPLGYTQPPTDIPDAVTLTDLTPEMQRFAEQAVAGISQTENRVQALHYALLGPNSAGALGILYNTRATYTPREVFVVREANCLSFSLLFVAMARHVGLKASINDVTIPPAWNMEQGRVQFLRHVNARVELPRKSPNSAIGRTGGALVVDLDMQNFRSYYPQQLISDERAKAQYFNNRAMEVYARDEDSAMSFYFLQAALGIDQEQSFLWNNLASIYRRAHMPDMAEALYVRALEVDPWDLTVIHNLSQVYHETGREPLAMQLQYLVRGYQERNPYYQYRLASQFYMEQDYQQAALRIENAIRKQPEERVFYQLAAEIYGQLGAPDKRQLMLNEL